MTDTQQHHNPPQAAQLLLLKRLEEEAGRPHRVPASHDAAVKRIRGLSSRPTPRQLGLLRKLAGETGVSFEWPTTFTGAEEEIDRLIGKKAVRGGDRRRESRQADRDFAGGFHGATSYRDDELQGHRSTATWADHA